MAIEFACHQCGGHFSAPEQLAGRRAKCKRCGAVVTVPIGLPREAANSSAARVPAPVKKHVVRAVVTVVPEPPDLSAEFPADASPRTSAYTLPAVAAPRTELPWPLLISAAAVVTLLCGFVGIGFVVAKAWPTFTVSSAPAQQAQLPPVIAPPPAVTDSARAAPAPPVALELSNLPAAPRAPAQPAKFEAPPEPAFNTTWHARPDPPSAPVTYKEGKLAISLPSNVDLLMPRAASHFVLGTVNDFRKNVWQVFDLRTGKEIGKTIQQKLDIDQRTAAFSPDGRYLAAVRRDFGSFGKETIVGVWSFATGEMTQALHLPAMFLSAPLCFAAPHQLVTLHEAGWSAAVITLWDLQSGSKIREISLPRDVGNQRLRSESLAISPGGRYATIILGQQVGVIDLSTGQPAGVALLPEAPSSCDGVMFSPDGAELGLMLFSFAGHRLVVFDFATGRLSLDHDYRGRLPHFWYDGPALDWLPDKSGLIYAGHLLLERTTGEEVWIFPNTDTTPRRFLRDGQVLVLLGGRNGKVLQTADLPERDIARSMQSIKDGGAAVDAVLPPLTTGNVFSASPVALPTGPSPFAYQPDPAGPMPRGLEREVLLATGDETIRRIGFASPESGKVVVQKEVTPRGVVGRRLPRRVVLERYDLATGDKGNTVEVPYVYQFADVSPTGKSVIVAFAQKGSNHERLDVLSLAPKKHVAGWRPYAGERDPADGDEQRRRSPRLWGQPDSPRSLIWAALLDEERVLTLNAAGKLICWRLPDCQATYVFEEFGEPLALSPTRRYLAGNHHGQFRLFDAASGQCVGDLQSPRFGSRAVRGVFRGDAEEFAAIIDAGPDKMLCRWNLHDGKLLSETPLPSEAVANFVPFHAAHDGSRLGLEYRGPNHLLIDDKHLVDLTRQAVVWRYHVAGILATNSPDHRTWYCTPKPHGPDKSLFLTAYDTPSSLVQQKAASITLVRQLILQPGMSVRLQVDLSGAGFAELQPTVEGAVREGLELRGLKVESTADLVFSVVAAERSTGKTIYVFDRPGYNPFRDPRDAKSSFSQQELAVRLAVSNSAGKVLWHRDQAVAMAGWGQVREDLDANQQVRAGMLRGFANLLASSGAATESVPRYIFADLPTIIAGASTLGFHQEGPPPQIKLPENEQHQQPLPGIAPGT